MASVEMPNAVSPALYALGFLISTTTLHIFGLLIGEIATTQAWLIKALRLTGGAVAASGVAFLLPGRRHLSDATRSNA